MEEESRSSYSPSRPAGRIPPQDLTAEKSLLGAILLDDKSFPEILERIKTGDFYEERHNLVYKAMTTLYQQHKPIDLLTLTAELRAEKNLKKVGGSPYITELTNFVPTASHILAYADLVEKTALRRKLISVGTEIAENAYEEDAEVGVLIGAAEKALFEVSDKTVKTDYTALEDLLADAFDRMEELHKNKGALRGLKTGFRDLDKKTAGFQKGDLIIVGARPAMGKTTFAENLAYNIATINNRGVLFFSMEMACSEFVDRMVSDVSGVDNWKIRTGNLSEDDFGKIGDALGDMGSVPLYLDDTSSMNILELRNKARRAAHDHDIGMIIVDYLQLLQGSDPAGITVFVQDVEDGAEIHVPVAGNGEHAHPDGLKEAPSLGHGPVADPEADVLQVHVAHPADVLSEHGDRIDAGEGQVAGIKEQPHVLRVRFGKEAVDLFRGLDAGAHVVVAGELHALFGGQGPQTVEALGHLFPFLFGVRSEEHHV